MKKLYKVELMKESVFQEKGNTYSLSSGYFSKTVYVLAEDMYKALKMAEEKVYTLNSEMMEGSSILTSDGSLRDGLYDTYTILSITIGSGDVVY